MKSKALIVAINEYPGFPLAGCVNDGVDMANFLVDHCGFAMREIRMLTDARATTQAILDRLAWLVAGLQPGDRMLFHFSGHGAQVASRDPLSEEVDGLDEVICPVDFQWREGFFIRDNQFANVFSAVPAGVEAVWISDSCHSGGLSREYGVNECSPRYLRPPPDVEWRNRIAITESKKVNHIAPDNINITLLTACASNQTAADASFKFRPNGAFTFCLLNALSYPGSLELQLRDVVPKVKAQLKSRGFFQDPGIEGSEFGMGRGFMSIPPST
jgi:hypothetical protein